MIGGRRLGPAGWDIVAGLGLLALAALLWWQATLLPPPIFDPVGSAFMPKAVALVIAGLSLIMIAGAFGAARAEWAESPPDADTQERWAAARRAVAVVVMLVVYGALLETDGVGFTLATILFVAPTGILLSRGNRRIMIASAVSAVLLAVACSYVFTQIFYIDLP